MKKLLAVFLASLMIFSAIPTFAADGVTDIYVSVTSGSDSAVGSAQAPLRSMEAALSIAKNELALGKAVNIILRGGEYRLNNVITLNSTYSGVSAEKPLTIKGFEGEEAVFKASQVIDVTNAQPVTDEKVRERLYEDVRDKLIVVDLGAQGIDSGHIFQSHNVNNNYQLNQNTEGNFLKASEYNCVYVDGKEQSLSRWPNDRHYARWTKALNDQTFYYEDAEPSRWTEAKDYWFAGFPTYDYSFSRMSIKEVNPEEKTVKLIDKPVGALTSYMTRRWAAYNLLEEIDVPGEFYIDRDNMLLYFYPPYSLKDAKVELSIAETPAFLVDGAKNIIFENLNFDQFRGNAFYARDVDNVDVINCNFTNIGVNAVKYAGGVPAETGKNHWAKQNKNASFNCDIRGCNFYNIGMSAIDMGGGDVDLLIPSNNVIEDNFINRVSQKSLWEAINVRGMAITVRNNNLSNGAGNAIRPWGSQQIVEYNEFSSFTRENDDCAAIYFGGSMLFRGTQANYNYLHDLPSIEPMVYNAKVALYWDDAQSGNSAQNNILMGTKTAFNSNGAGATTHRWNFAIDVTNPFNLIDHQHRTNETITMSTYYTLEETRNNIPNKELYYKAYPTLEQEMSGVNPKKFSKIYENMAFRTGPYKIGKQEQQFSYLKDNLVFDNLDMFVDPDNHDWRLKADSELAIKYPNLINENNFSMDSIGLKTKRTLDETTAPFKMLYPRNGADAVSAIDHEFLWENAYGATHYRLVVAKDIDFTDIVYDDIVYHCSTTLDCLEKGTTYYWKVEAMSFSKEFTTPWKSESGVWAFRTAINDEIDTYGATIAVETALKRAETIREGIVAGDYKIGTKKKLYQYANLLSFFTKGKLPMLTQARLDSYAELVSGYLSNPDLINAGYMDLSTHFIPHEWAGDLTVTKDYVLIENDEYKNHFVGTNSLDATTGNVIYCFDAQVELPEEPGAWMSLGLSLYNDRNQYTSVNMGYYIVLKHNLIELQRVTGSKNQIIATADYQVVDGNRHSFRFGRIKLDTGNYITIYIDDKPIFIYPDVDGTELSSTNQFVTCIYNGGTTVKYLPYGGTLPDSAAFEAHKVQGLKDSVKAIYDVYAKEFTDYAIVNVNSRRIMTNKGLYEISAAPVANDANEVFVTADTLEKMFAATVSMGAASADVTLDGATVTTPVHNKNGVDMICINDALLKLNKSFTYDWQHGNLIVAGDGNLVVLNEGTRLQKTKEIFIATEHLGSFDFN